MFVLGEDFISTRFSRVYAHTVQQDQIENEKSSFLSSG